MREKVRVLIIEDKPDLAAGAQREIEEAFEESDEIEVKVEVETDFDEGLEKFRKGDSDVVVLDVRREDAPSLSSEDAAAGHAVYLNIKEARFAPVIFWTALPESVIDEEMAPLVTVVTKDDTDQLPEAIKAAVASRAVITIRGIEKHVANVLRKHMWTELAPNWDEYTQDAESAGIAQILLRRLARVLEDDRDGALTALPSHRYIYPPASEVRAPGDILRGTDQTWWVALTPACDFAQDKVGFVLLAHATPLEEHPKYRAWKDEYTDDKNKGKAEHNRGKSKWNTLRQDVLTSTRGRFHFLPAFRGIPDLVIDLEDVHAEAGGDLSGYVPVASLSSPFAESLLIQHSHHRGRIGVPDLDAELIKQRLVAGLRLEVSLR